jgi:formate dehydrogenase iron-sulfur subunit
MRRIARERLGTLHNQGVMEAQLYGEKEYGGLHALFLLTDKPEAFGLPNTQNAVLPSRNNRGGYLGSLVTAVVGVLGAVVAFRNRGAQAAEG